MIYLLLIILGFCGFSVLIRDKFALEIYFIPFVYFSFLSSLVYIFALVGFMKESSYIFHGVFGGLCLYYLFRKREVFRDFIDYWIFGIIGIFSVTAILHQLELTWCCKHGVSQRQQVPIKFHFRSQTN